MKLPLVPSLPMKKNYRLVVVIIVVITLVLLPIAYVFYEAFSILGPWGSPDFADKPWARLTVNYELVTDKGNLSRGTIFNGIVLHDLQKVFNVKESRGKSTPSPGYLILETNDGSRWRIHFSMPDYIGTCRDEDDYYAYAIDLADTSFHEALRKKCLERERRATPQANIENIKVCTGGLGKIQEECTPLHVDTP
ncbi:MAG: hypothetical protein LBJ00_06885 [Planctomycetaceae bacterium]|jgi:hypothetical protein|nr:hypothetical protein [Planctomycetaceae bacterium]